MLPPLPEAQNGGWSDAVYNAHAQITQIFNRATQLLSEEADPLRLKMYAEDVEGKILPLLQAMEDSAIDEGLPMEWLGQCGEATGILYGRLMEAFRDADSRVDSNINIPVLVHEYRSFRPGRPRKVIDADFLNEAMSPRHRISLTELADDLGITTKTLVKCLQDAQVFYKFSAVTDEELDQFIRDFRRERPQVGLQYVIGHLRSKGQRIQERRIRESMNRTGGLAAAMRNPGAIRRTAYQVPRPNALWHLDGHHKLILWGFVIHGIVDGYCRTVTGLKASTNNRSSTVLALFLTAAEVYSSPSRIRGDRGGENKGVCIYMILRKGANRGSFIWGSSTHNTRIERLWVEVGRHFARSWRAFFYRLERMHRLERSNPIHLWLLHHLFLDDINADCDAFQQDWNHKPISGSKGKNESPADKRFGGQAKYGVYADHDADIEGWSLEDLIQYYGVEGPEKARSPYESGAGELDDEDILEVGEEVEVESGVEAEDAADEEDWDQITQLEEGCGHHFVPKPIGVPRSYNPFDNLDNSQFETFQNLQADATANGLLPEEYGILPHEWPEDHYPTAEIIRSGRRGLKDLRVELTVDIWMPRAERWVRALAILNRLIEESMNSNE